MTPSLRGWEAFPTPGALTHTRITWALSPPAPQVPGVTPGSPLCPWCFGHPFGEVRENPGPAGSPTGTLYEEVGKVAIMTDPPTVVEPSEQAGGSRPGSFGENP